MMSMAVPMSMSNRSLAAWCTLTLRMLLFDVTAAIGWLIASLKNISNKNRRKKNNKSTPKS